jgi:hypothetical protein
MPLSTGMRRPRSRYKYTEDHEREATSDTKTLPLEDRNIRVILFAVANGTRVVKAAAAIETRVNGREFGGERPQQCDGRRLPRSHRQRGERAS